MLLSAGAALVSGPDRPSASECDALYRHQLALFQQADSPIAPALLRQKNNLLRADSMRAQREQCLVRLSREDLRCQMAARSLQELLACGSSVRPENGDGPKDKTEKSEKTEVVVTQPTVRQWVRAVNTETCDRAYEHMLPVHATSASFQKRPDAKRLMEHWQSPGARESFRRRCQRAFRVADLNCILSAKDAESLQACLLDVGG